MKKIPICFDSGPGTVDRLTLIYSESRAHGERTFLYIASSESGAGFWEHGEIKAQDITTAGKVTFAHLGKRVPFDSLSFEVRTRYRNERTTWKVLIYTDDAEPYAGIVQTARNTGLTGYFYKNGTYRDVYTGVRPPKYILEEAQQLLNNL